MSTRILMALVATGMTLVAGTVAAAGVVEEKWQITTKMEMVGMPFAMPEQTTTICVPPGQKNEKMVPTDEKCKVSNFKTVGNTSSFHVECPAPEKMSGDGQFTVLGADSTKGQMHMKVVDGKDVNEMKMSWASKKLGTCDAVKDRGISATAMVADANAAQAKSCVELAKGMVWNYAEQMAATCPTLKADICKTAKASFDKPKTSKAALDMQDKRTDWKGLAGYCGIDPATVNKKYCGYAKTEKNWNNAALLCGKDDDLKAIAVKECTGKMYTSGLIADEYQSLCALYADDVDPGTDPNAKPKSATQKATDTGKKAIDGFKKLKGFLQ